MGFSVQVLPGLGCGGPRLGSADLSSSPFLRHSRAHMEVATENSPGPSAL
jgi:hypothetical protein